MRLLTLLLCLTLSTAAFGAELPEWAKAAVNAVDLNAPPAGFDTWRLLDELTATQKADGSMTMRRRQVQVLIREQGSQQAGSYSAFGDEEGTTLKKLRGWHRKGDSIVLLDRNNIVTVGSGSDDNASTRYINTRTQTVAGFENVSRGDVVAFESISEEDGFFSFISTGLTGQFPTAKMVIRLDLTDGGKVRFFPINTQAWGLEPVITDNTFTLTNIPGYDPEIAAPRFLNPYAYLVAVSLEGKESRLESWDSFAAWYHNLFNINALAGAAPTQKVSDAATIKEIAAFFSQKISYKQRYLSAARGWVPAKGDEVERRAYGDCKDMVSCLAWRSAKDNFQILPVLANISNGAYTGPDHIPGPFFNHLIAAIPLEKSLGMPAEVTVDNQIYLIMDPTAAHTLPGRLPAAYNDRSVLICTADKGIWVDIPKIALEQDQITLNLKGDLDAAMNFSGTLTVEEDGNAMFMRSTHLNSNQQMQEWRLRSFFALPGTLELQPGETQLKDGRFTVTYQVNWPGFLKRDSGGLRLPQGITGEYQRNLVESGRTRKLPIALNHLPKIEWRLDINSAVALKPGGESAQWQGKGHSFSWQAKGGNTLKVNYTKTADRMLFNRDQIEEGLNYWQERKQAYNRFFFNEALFQKL